MNRKSLYLITEEYPFKLDEKPFIYPELDELSSKFDVTIVSSHFMSENENGIRSDLDMKDSIKIVNYPYGGVVKFEVIKYIIPFFLDLCNWREIAKIIRAKQKILGRIKHCLFFYASGVKYYHWFKEQDIIKKDEQGVIYSYWYNYRILLLCKYRNKFNNCKILTRAHGYDLYEDQSTVNWQPYKSYMDMKLDQVIFISEHGYRYYIKHFAQVKDNIDKYQIFRLGITRQEIKKLCTSRNFFLLVSCSGVIPVKRVHLIVEALSKIDFHWIKWVHFGNGDLLESIRMDAENLLGTKDNITYKFMGMCPNQEILRYYQENVPDAIILTSYSEGSPVALQEALACAIPIIATAVGGIPEMIDGNGILLSANPTADQVADAIMALCNMNDEERTIMRIRSLEIWEADYDRERNTKKFVDCLQELMEEGIN